MELTSHPFWFRCLQRSYLLPKVWHSSGKPLLSSKSLKQAVIDANFLSQVSFLLFIFHPNKRLKNLCVSRCHWFQKKVSNGRLQSGYFFHKPLIKSSFWSNYGQLLIVFLKLMNTIKIGLLPLRYDEFSLAHPITTVHLQLISTLLKPVRVISLYNSLKQENEEGFFQ